MNRFFWWLAEKLRPFHNSGLSEELEFPEVPLEDFIRGEMLRCARLDLAGSAYELLGKEYLRRGARAWRPRELLLMEDLSLAWSVMESQRLRGIMVEPVHVDRLVEILFRYFAYIREPKTRQQVRADVNRYIDEHSVAEPEVDPMAFHHIKVDHPLLDQLRELDEEARLRFPGDYDPGLGSIGLILNEELDESRYEHCTPINCRTFAHTGGEGVHFSLMVLDGAITEASPVVVTMPADHQSLVGGETLFDFLCLGVRRGYFALEQLGSDVALKAYTDAEWKATEKHHYWVGFGVDEHDRQLLDFLSERLGLQPWTNPRRFDELQEKYGPMIRLPPYRM